MFYNYLSLLCVHLCIFQILGLGLFREGWGFFFSGIDILGGGVAVFQGG